MAMALLVLMQGLALHGAGDGLGSTVFGQICESSLTAQGAEHAPAPATGAKHDCAACIVCAFSAAIGNHSPVLVRPAALYTTLDAPSDTPAAPVFRWRAAHPARAPPRYS